MNWLFTSGGQSLELQLQHWFFQWVFRIDFFRINWFDLLAVQGTLKSLLQHCSSKASILKHSAFFMVQLSHPYMTTEKKHRFDYVNPTNFFLGIMLYYFVCLISLLDTSKINTKWVLALCENTENYCSILDKNRHSGF